MINSFLLLLYSKYAITLYIFSSINCGLGRLAAYLSCLFLNGVGMCPGYVYVCVWSLAKCLFCFGFVCYTWQCSGFTLDYALRNYSLWYSEDHEMPGFKPSPALFLGFLWCMHLPHSPLTCLPPRQRGGAWCTVWPMCQPALDLLGIAQVVRKVLVAKADSSPI